jgi:hypothetical protein
MKEVSTSTAGETVVALEKIEGTSSRVTSEDFSNEVFVSF